MCVVCLTLKDCFYYKIFRTKNGMMNLANYSAPSVYRPPFYRQNSRLSRFPPLQIPRYTANLSYRHSFSDTKVVKPIQIPPLVPPTTTF